MHNFLLKIKSDINFFLSYDYNLDGLVRLMTNLSLIQVKK